MRTGSLAIVVMLGLCTMPALASDGICQQQAGEILRRIQAEVAPGWNTQQKAAANAIVLDVCEVRQQQVVREIEQATQQAREEEKALAESWWKENTDKAGNKRLKRKGH